MRALPLALIAAVAVGTSSCELLKRKEAAPTAYDPYGQSANPYGQAPAPNPYAQAPAANPYAQAPAANPYAQAPASNPYGSYEAPAASAPAPAYDAAPSAPVAPTAPSGGSVTVKGGDTLTGIAKRHGTSVAALRSANGLTGDLIKVGQMLNLP